MTKAKILSTHFLKKLALNKFKNDFLDQQFLIKKSTLKMKFGHNKKTQKS